MARHWPFDSCFLINAAGVPMLPTHFVTRFRFCAFATILALSASTIGAAQSLCDVIAEAERAAASRSPGTGQWTSAGPIVAGPLELHETVGTIVEYVRSSYRISAPLSDALARIASYGTGWAANLSRFGQGATGLRMIDSDQGTAHCQVLLFFDVAPDGSARLVDDPPGVEPGQLCSNRSGHAGEVLGTPTFVATDEKLPATDIVKSLTPWQGDTWQRSCSIHLRFRDAFGVADRACRGVDCEKIEADVLRLVERLDRRTPQVSNEPPFERKTFDRMKALAVHLRGFLDMLPRDRPSQFQTSLIEFRDDVLVPFVFDGKTYLARIGHAGFHSLITSNYLFNAYQLVDDHLDLVAEFYVDKGRGRLLSATVE